MAFAASTSRWRWWLRTEPAKVKPTFGRCGFLIKIQPEKPNVVVFFVGSPRKLVAGGARNMSHVLAGGNRIMNNETILYSSAASFWGGAALWNRSGWFKIQSARPIKPSFRNRLHACPAWMRKRCRITGHRRYLTRHQEWPPEVGVQEVT